MKGQHRVVRLNDGVGDLGRRDDGIGRHDAIRILLTDLGDQKGAHAGAGAAAQTKSKHQYTFLRGNLQRPYFFSLVMVLIKQSKKETKSVPVGHLKARKAIAALRFLADDVKDAVDELGAFRVVALGPIVAGASLAEDEIVGAEELKNLKFG